MSRPIRILLQTTIPAVEDDWNVALRCLCHDHRDGAPLGAPPADRP